MAINAATIAPSRYAWYTYLCVLTVRDRGFSHCFGGDGGRTDNQRVRTLV